VTADGPFSWTFPYVEQDRG